MRQCGPCSAEPLSCGKCGGAVVAVDALCYGCAAHKDRGPSICSGISARRDGRRPPAALRPTRRFAVPRCGSRDSSIHVQEAFARGDRMLRWTRRRSGSRLGQLEHEIGTAGRRHRGNRDLSRPESAARRRGRRDGRTQESAPSDSDDTGHREGIAPRYKRLVNDLEGALKHDTARAVEFCRDIFAAHPAWSRRTSGIAEFAARTERLLVAGGIRF